MGKSDFVDYVVHDLLSGLDNIRSRAMFGGHGIYRDDVFFAIIVDDQLYFKVDDIHKKKYEKLGSKPFSYLSKGKKIVMSYWEVPIEIMDDREMIARWAEASCKIVKSKNKRKLAFKKR